MPIQAGIAGSTDVTLRKYILTLFRYRLRPKRKRKRKYRYAISDESFEAQSALWFRFRTRLNRAKLPLEQWFLVRLNPYDEGEVFSLPFPPQPPHSGEDPRAQPWLEYWLAWQTAVYLDVKASEWTGKTRGAAEAHQKHSGGCRTFVRPVNQSTEQ